MHACDMCPLIICVYMYVQKFTIQKDRIYNDIQSLKGLLSPKDNSFVTTDYRHSSTYDIVFQIDP